jgi:uncharacterized membrane protein YdjX (TVP38/TMEM64 family)
MPCLETLKHHGCRWLFLSCLVLAVILIPFLFFSASLDGWITGFLQTTHKPGRITAWVLGLLLASDVLLPIPSSLVSTAAGGLHGVWAGTMVSVVGMTVSCGLGYWIGAHLGRQAVSRFVGSREFNRLEALHRRWGHWMIMGVRSIPVLAEASTFVAGMSLMPFGMFLIISVLSNLGISLVYATIGAYAVQFPAFWFAFVGAWLVPTLVMVLRLKRRHIR